MITTILTTKGQVVIPSSIRNHMRLKKGTKLCVIEQGDRIILQPLTSDYFENMAGILRSKGKLTRALLDERTAEKEREDKR